MSDIKIIALGGVRENAKNLYLYFGCWSKVS